MQFQNDSEGVAGVTNEEESSQDDQEEEEDEEEDEGEREGDDDKENGVCDEEESRLVVKEEEEEEREGEREEAERDGGSETEEVNRDEVEEEDSDFEFTVLAKKRRYMYTSVATESHCGLLVQEAGGRGRNRVGHQQRIFTHNHSSKPFTRSVYTIVCVYLP